MKVFGFLGPLFLALGLAAAIVAVSGDAQTWLEQRFGAGCEIADCGGTFSMTGVILALVFLPMGGAFTWIALPSRKARDKDRVLKARRATATILSLEDSGQRVQGMPYVKFQLQLERDGHPPQMISTGSVVRKFTKLAPGDRLPVLVDPDNPNKVKIDWDR